jgi:thymidylate synthase (FAD)
MDPRFRVEVIAQTPNPQQCIYAAMHQDYSEGFVFDERNNWPDETKAGEICVNRLLKGERGHYGCYSSDTEVLTSEGWLYWPNVTASSMLAAVDIHTNLISFEKPTALQKVQLNAEDNLYSLASQKLDILVTLDHRMVITTKKHAGNWTEPFFASASDVVGKAVRYRLAGSLKTRHVPSHCPSGVDLISLFKLAGFFYGDGCKSSNIDPKCLRFRLRKARKIAYLNSLGFHVDQMQSDRFTLREKEVSRWVHKYFTHENGKAIPLFIMHLPSGLFDAFADGLKNSDGTPSRSNHTWSFDSKEKRSLDILQAAFHLNDKVASISLNNPNEGVGHENHAPCWRIHISSRKPYARSEVNQKGRTRGSEQLLVNYQGYVYCATVSTGALLVRRNNKPFISGNCLEHPQIILNCGYFPHSVMQQARTHRVGVSFDVQSMRYTGDRICKAANGELDLEDVFYLRPPGHYSDRKGRKYEYTSHQRYEDLHLCTIAAKRYRDLISAGFAEEHARGILPFDYRQHFVVSFNARSFMHFLDLRAKLDAQLEIRQLCDLMWPHLQDWAPQIAEWYQQSRLHKARLAP